MVTTSHQITLMPLRWNNKTFRSSIHPLRLQWGHINFVKSCTGWTGAYLLTLASWICFLLRPRNSLIFCILAQVQSTLIHELGHCKCSNVTQPLSSFCCMWLSSVLSVPSFLRSCDRDIWELSISLVVWKTAVFPFLLTSVEPFSVQDNCSYLL